ncbi:hypothetical protein CRENBAI_005409 [Crenichthys baileyi]|uniref:Uncharacterized protein n=1 Tax=Crenichthys baileyi TaxID=28760 RepID=A0AAV9RGB3_9TELE
MAYGGFRLVIAHLGQNHLSTITLLPSCMYSGDIHAFMCHFASHTPASYGPCRRMADNIVRVTSQVLKGMADASAPASDVLHVALTAALKGLLTPLVLALRVRPTLQLLPLRVRLKAWLLPLRVH